MDKPEFARYYRYEEMTALLQAYEREFRGLAALESIGTSYEGRDIWSLIITNGATGAVAGCVRLSRTWRRSCASRGSISRVRI